MIIMIISVGVWILDPLHGLQEPPPRRSRGAGRTLCLLGFGVWI